MNDDVDLLVCGAGPTGLVLALWARRQGLSVRIVDRAAEPGTTSRALAVQARTLELYRQLGLTDDVLAHGHRVPAMNLWVQGRPAARVPLAELAEGLSPYPPFIFPQDEHERLLIRHLAAAGVRVERPVELLGFEDRGDHVAATLQAAGPGPDAAARQAGSGADPDPGPQSCRARWLAGCDGAGSTVRKALHGAFPGGTYDQLFYVADVEAAGPAVDGELHVDLDDADFLAVFPMRGAGRARLVGTVRDERARDAAALRFDDVGRRAIEQLQLDVRAVHWFSTYHVHHRVTGRFRHGRVFLLGDAAHIHSPAGGQGMNTGIGDAINLAWKLAMVRDGRAPDALLDSYGLEREGFARRLVATTDRAFTLATAEGPLAALVRTRLVPWIAPALLSVDAVRRYAFTAVSQLVVHYRDSPLSHGQAGEVHGGDRLPWVPLPPEAGRTLAPADNFDVALGGIGWQVHVHGRVDPAFAAACARHGLPLHAWPWHPLHERAGLARDGALLLRPDAYVAAAWEAQPADALDAYLAQRGLVPVEVPLSPMGRGGFRRRARARRAAAPAGRRCRASAARRSAGCTRG